MGAGGRVKTTITQLMLQMKQFDCVEIRWAEVCNEWEVSIHPEYPNTLEYHCYAKSSNLRIALMAALHQTEKWQLLNAFNLEVERLQAVRTAEAHARGRITEAKAEKDLEEFSAFYRFSEHVVGRVMWGD